MADNRKPDEKEHKVSEKDYITNKVLLVFTLCLFGILGLMLLYRLIGYGSTYGLGVICARVVLGIGAAMLLWGIIRTVWEHKTNADLRLRIVRGRNISIVAAVIIICMLVILLCGPTSVKLFYIVLPALAIYYLIYHSYPREFFIISLDCGAAAVLLVTVRRAQDSTHFHSVAYLCAAAALVLAILQTLLVRRAQNKKLVGLVDGRQTQLFSSAHAYQIMYLSAALLLAFVLVGTFAGAQISYYLIFATFGYLFITAVYYTVKMM